MKTTTVLAFLALAQGCNHGGVKPPSDSEAPREETGRDTGPPAVATDLRYANVEFVGETAGDYASIGLAGAGDLNGDGYAEVLVGASGNDEAGSQAGKAYLIDGREARLAGEVNLDEATHSFLGEAGGDNAGDTVAGPGDVDGDGVGDLLVTAYENDDGGGSAGKVYLLSGRAALAQQAWSLANAHWALVGEEGGYNLGVSADGAGDVDGDGLADLVIGALGDHQEGFVHVVLGREDASGVLPISQADYTLEGESEGDNAGFAVAGVGDVDGDGLADVLVGAFGRDEMGTTAGAAYLLYGASLPSISGADLGAADLCFNGGSSGEAAGFAVAGAGDVDADGLADLLISADCSNQGGALSGKAYLLYGASVAGRSSLNLTGADVHLIGELPGDRAGGALSAAGDVDGDGRDDVLVGAPYASVAMADEGRAYLVLASSLDGAGTMSLNDADGAWVGAFAGDLAGRSLARLGDLSGDGVDDLLIGATHTNENGNDSGKAYVIFGGAY